MPRHFGDGSAVVPAQPQYVYVITRRARALRSANAAAMRRVWLACTNKPART
jgi:hypothetical protein